MTATMTHLNERHARLVADAEALDQVADQIRAMEEREQAAKDLLANLAAARDFRAVLERTVAREQAALDRERDLTGWTPPLQQETGELPHERAARAASTTTQALPPITLPDGPNGTLTAPHPELLGDPLRHQDVSAEAMQAAIEPPSTDHPSGAHKTVSTPKGAGRG